MKYADVTMPVPAAATEAASSPTSATPPAEAAAGADANGQLRALEALAEAELCYLFVPLSGDLAGSLTTAAAVGAGSAATTAPRAGFPVAATAAAFQAPAGPAPADVIISEVCHENQLQEQEPQMYIDWGSISTIRQSVRPVLDVLADPTAKHHSTAAGAAGSPGSTPPAPVTAADVISAGQLLLGKVLVSGHSSQLYRCAAIADHMTPSTVVETPFRWRALAAGGAAGTASAPQAVQRGGVGGTDSTGQAVQGSSTGLSAGTAAAGARARSVGGAEGGGGNSSAYCTAYTHEEYYRKRYGVEGLNTILPMLAVVGPGRHAAMGLREVVLQPGGRQTGSAKASVTEAVANASPAAAGRAGVVLSGRADASGALAAAVPAATAAAGASSAAAPDVNLSVAPEHASEVESEKPPIYLPLELCWLLPISSSSWNHLQLLPAFMYRSNSLLRLHKMHQHLHKLQQQQQQQQQQQGILGPTSAVVAAAAMGAGATATEERAGAAGTAAAAAAAMESGARATGASQVGLGWKVPDPALLLVALTGTGAREGFDQGALEYLGDVVLKFLATNYLLQVRVTEYLLVGF